MNSNSQRTLAQLRYNFLEFMKSQGYQIIKPDLLISDAFPTTFNVSGGPNFADDYLDKFEKQSENIVTIQHCIRHWDYDKVGDGLHLSFFEMGVTTAFNGYNQKELFQSHMKFLVDTLKFPVESLYITVFGGGNIRGKYFNEDMETMNSWKSIGIRDENLVLIPQEVPKEIADKIRNEKGEDFVEREAFVANAVEPVGGPRTEIFFDTGKPSICEPKCIPGFCTCGRFIEFWTSVHYICRVTPLPDQRDRQGEVILNFEELPQDTRIYAAGFGLERVLMLLLNKNNICEIEPIPEVASIILNRIEGTFNKEIEKHIWAIAEHIRGLTFLLVENVHELTGKINRSRKYQYRRYIKSLLSHINYLNVQFDFSLLRQLIEKVLDTYLKDFPYNELYARDTIDINAITNELINRMQMINEEF